MERSGATSLTSRSLLRSKSNIRPLQGFSLRDPEAASAHTKGHFQETTLVAMPCLLSTWGDCGWPQSKGLLKGAGKGLLLPGGVSNNHNDRGFITGKMACSLKKTEPKLDFLSRGSTGSGEGNDPPMLGPDRLCSLRVLLASPGSCRAL